MIKFKLFHDRIGIFEIVLFLIVQLLIIAIILNISTDIQAHLGFVRDYIQGKNQELPSNFLYYFIIYLFSFISTKTIFLLPICAIILALSIFLKYYICKRFFLTSGILNPSAQSIKVVSIASAMLIFAFSVPIGYILKPYFYLGYFPPNVWHNSTTIFTMPFVLLLFILSIYQLQNFKREYILWMVILIFLNAIAKPSFLFVFIPTFSLFALLFYGLSKKFWLSMIPIFLSILLIFVQYYFIYHIEGVHHSENTEVGVAIRPFYFFREQILMTLNPALQMVIFLTGSVIFPAVYIVRNFDVFKKSIWIQFAVACMAFGLMIAYLIIETGERTTHGNFLWQAIMANFILFFVCLYELIKQLDKTQFNFRKYRPEIFAFSLHFIMGILYFVHMFFRLTYH